VDATGKGILDAAGLGEETPQGESASPGDDDDPVEDAQPKKAPRELTWWEEYLKRREEKRKKSHTPGVWVVYFSLAALPLFGLGQLFIPAGDAAKRSYIFWLLAIYVASGLGLLLTTSFLGLRRYLRQRKVTMPAAMTGAWLAFGGVLVIALVGIGLLIPLPSPGDLLGKPDFMGSKDRQASKYAVKRDGSGKGKGPPSSSKNKDPDAQAGSGNMRDQQGGQTKSGDQGSGGKQQSNNAQSSSAGKSNQQGDSGKSNSQSNQSQNNQAQNSQAQNNQQNQGPQNQNNQGNQNQANSNQSNSGAQKQPGDKNPGQNEQNQNSQGTKNGDQKSNDQDQGDKEKQDAENKDDAGNESEGGSGSSSTDTSSAGQLFEEATSTVGQVLKWIAIIVGILIAGYFVIKFLANFNSWFKALLLAIQNLFGKKEENQAAAAAVEEEEEEWTPKPFAEYPDPFLTGAAETQPPAQVVRYSFEALESWAWENHLARQPDETPSEFAERLGAQVPKLDAHVKRVADLFARITYARQTPTKNALPVLRQFWQALTGASAPAEAVVE
jgi:hypothetical protein